MQDTMMHHANNQQAQHNNMVLQANKQSVDYKIMAHDNKRPSKDNNTIRHQEDAATNGMPNDDKATSTKDKTIIIH